MKKGKIPKEYYRYRENPFQTKNVTGSERYMLEQLLIGRLNKIPERTLVEVTLSDNDFFGEKLSEEPTYIVWSNEYLIRNGYIYSLEEPVCSLDDITGFFYEKSWKL